MKFALEENLEAGTDWLSFTICTSWNLRFHASGIASVTNTHQVVKMKELPLPEYLVPRAWGLRESIAHLLRGNSRRAITHRGPLTKLLEIVRLNNLWITMHHTVSAFNPVVNDPANYSPGLLAALNITHEFCVRFHIMITTCRGRF